LSKANLLAEHHLQQPAISLPASPCKATPTLIDTAQTNNIIEVLFGGTTMVHSQPKPKGSELNTYSGIRGLGIESLTRQDSLDWWKQHQHQLPQLAALAQKYLAIMATSAPVERVFSASGWVVSKRRCRMTDATVVLLTFLVVNKHHLNLSLEE